MDWKKYTFTPNISEGNLIMKKIIRVIFLVLLVFPIAVMAQDDMLEVTSETVLISSDGMDYESYLAYPDEDGIYPAIVLIHSFNGMEQGYVDMTDLFASEGFVVLAVGWQTFERSPSDAVVEQLLLDSIDFLTARDDVDPEKLGLTGFCAGGRYTMLFMPQINAFNAGVSWYGFPNNGSPSPSDLIEQLDAPMLIIHGTDDSPSPIADIYAYATELGNVGADFELKVYANEPHGFMLSGGELRTDDVATDAYHEMVDYFTRMLGA